MSKHDKKVNQIVTRPSLIGLENIIFSTDEGHIFSQHWREKGQLIGEPDGLMFDPTTRTLYNLEYKTSDRRSDALYQLARNGAILQAMFWNWNVVDTYVHGEFEVEFKEYGQGNKR